MGGLSRYVSVLRKFDEPNPIWTVLELAQTLDVPVSTVYRTVRELVAENFLARAGGAGYRVGTAFIQFDRIVRLTDPLSRLGEPALADLVDLAGTPCAALLCSLFNDEVMCIADVISADARFRPSYERGRPMPLIRGATSKVILAELPRRGLGRLLAGIEDPVAADLRRQLSQIRRQGFCIAHSELDPGLIGIAAAIVRPVTRTIASVSVVAESKVVNKVIEHRLISLVRSSAAALSSAIDAAEQLVGGEVENAG